MTIQWIDRCREPQEPPNPNYPKGIVLGVPAKDDRPQCIFRLPYPARRIGFYSVVCHECGIKVAITTAGRPDDPTAIIVDCKLQ